jgi:putative CRISPR-associated protein (TIGR02619 family)
MEYILSTCGTSILTNNTNEKLKHALTIHANARMAKNVSDVSQEERRLIEAHINERASEFATLSVRDARDASAELNGILAYYEDQPVRGEKDRHCLLTTDTWLGEATAGIVKAWLENNNICAVEVYRHNDLQTADWGTFSSSLSDLVKWCAEYVEPQRSPHCRVVFNLSGGFKSETGFLQLLGMFFADEVIYIFERSGELLRIPRLPVEMCDEQAIHDDLRDFRRASQGLSVIARKSGIYWFESDGQYTLSAWGELVFQKCKNVIYSGKVHESPSSNVIFGSKFLESCDERYEDVNRKIDLLARYMEDPQKPNLRTLDFKPLRGRGNPAVPDATHECDAWHDGTVKRIYCRLENDAVVLLKLGQALH